MYFPKFIVVICIWKPWRKKKNTLLKNSKSFEKKEGLWQINILVELRHYSPQLSNERYPQLKFSSNFLTFLEQLLYRIILDVNFANHQRKERILLICFLFGYFYIRKAITHSYFKNITVPQNANHMLTRMGENFLESKDIYHAIL